MIKRTLVISNPARLSTRQQQLLIENENGEHSVPIEDIGFLILEDRRISLTAYLLSVCSDNNVAVISCDSQHLPTGIHLSLTGHSTYSERSRKQLNSSQALKDNLWGQIISSKIAGQADVLRMMGAASAFRKLSRYSKEVQSGDPDNLEATAAQTYWPNYRDGFYRARNGPHPNAWLNYGYALVRACTARAIVGSGLMTVHGVFHRNKYNPHCLADDLMEPYRPFVDYRVWQLLQEHPDDTERLPKIVKVELLKLLSSTVVIRNQKSPLMNGVQHTANSLAQIFLGEKRKLILPRFEE